MDDTMLMYGVYNAEILDKSIKTVHEIHAHSFGLQHFSTNSLSYLRIIQDKYVALYRELITQLHTYVSAVRVLVKGYLPNTLIKPAKLQEILTEVKKTLQITNPDYDLVLDRLHLYYDMPLITFGIVKDMNLIVQFPVFIQPYTQNSLILYQLETVPIPILDKNTKAQSYMHLQIRKPYITLILTSISIKQILPQLCWMEVMK